ncbi:hypothetical protein MMPV_006279 [Pyropia vietnamensis]
MSGVGMWFRRSWASEPVVGFSILLGVIGVSLPVIVPPLWGTYPDTQSKTAMGAHRAAAAEASLADAQAVRAAATAASAKA